jgi:hypothetical protein
MNWKKGAGMAFAALWMGSPAAAQVYGSLANFDVVNDTGHDCHGFEVEIEDASDDRSKIYSVFGLDRDFGVPATSVERYGAPTITDLPGFGVTVRYEARFVNGAWTRHTPSGPYANPGDSCWPFGNPQYDSGTLTCDHFGVATYGTPARVNYRWLCDQSPSSDSGVLTPVPAQVPAVGYVYQPPPPPQPGDPPPAPEPVQIQIEAPDVKAEADDVFGRAYWVRLALRHADHGVELDQLMVDDPEVPGDREIEVEWELFQEGGGQGQLGNLQFIDPADQALVLRCEFYEYIGPVKADGEADCSGRQGAANGPDDCGGLGDYVGAQLAAIDAAPPEPVPALPLFAHPVGLIALTALAQRRFRGRANADGRDEAPIA